MAHRNPVSLLRRIGLIEAASFLVLLFVAMPLKYAADMPMAVKVAGWVHGVLFVALCAALVWTMIAARWGLGRGAVVFVAALVPFGPILLDPRMNGYAAEYAGRLPPRSAEPAP